MGMIEQQPGYQLYLLPWEPAVAPSLLYSGKLSPDVASFSHVFRGRPENIDRLSIEVDGRKMHLFIGCQTYAFFGKEKNARASVLFASGALRERGSVYTLREVIDTPPGMPLVSWKDAEFLLASGLTVSGPAILWTGELG